MSEIYFATHSEEDSYKIKSALKLQALTKERIEDLKNNKDSCVVFSALTHLQSLVKESEK